MAILAVTPITRAGVNDAGAAAAGGGDSFPNDGKTFVRVFNGGGSPITVTEKIPTTKRPEGLTITEKTVAVPAGEARDIGSWPAGIYNDADGRMNITYSGVTSVTVKALSLSPS